MISVHKGGCQAYVQVQMLQSPKASVSFLSYCDQAIPLEG